MIKKIKKKLRKLFNYYVTKHLELNIYKGEMKNIKLKKKLVDSVRLSKEQIKEIDNLFINNYGKKYSTKWHQLYQSYTKKYDTKYFPEILFSTKLERILNDRAVCSVYEDKALVEILYQGIDNLFFPETLVLNSNGIWYDCNRNIINKDEALKILKNSSETIWKATICSSSGKSIKVCNIENFIDKNSNCSLEQLINLYDRNFIVQKRLENCDAINKIYSKSLNTLRVITYIANDKVYHVPLVLRIGQKNKKVDNIHSGGMFIAISDSGELSDRAFTEDQEVYYEHPDTNVKFKNYRIPNIEKLIEIAYKCHGRTPNVGIISWDFAIGKDNKIYLIETNLIGQSIWFPQMAHGKSAFDNNTEYMLKKISLKKKVK